MNNGLTPFWTWCRRKWLCSHGDSTNHTTIVVEDTTRTRCNGCGKFWVRCNHDWHGFIDSGDRGWLCFRCGAKEWED